MTCWKSSNRLFLVDIPSASYCPYLNCFMTDVNFVNDSDAADFVSMFTLKFTVEFFYVRAEKWLFTQNINALIYSSFRILVLFLVLFLSFMGNKDIIHL